MSDDEDSTTYYTRIPDEKAEKIEWYRERKDLKKSEAIRALALDGLSQQLRVTDRVKSILDDMVRRGAIGVSLLFLVRIQILLAENAGHEWLPAEATLLVGLYVLLAMYMTTPIFKVAGLIWNEYHPTSSVRGET